MTLITDDAKVLEEWFVGVPDSRPVLKDPLHQRLADAVASWRTGGASEIDVAVLLRQVIRRLSRALGRNGLAFSAQWDLSPASLKQVHIDQAVVDGVTEWRSRPWRPEWLGCAEGMPDVDEAALAGLPAMVRAAYLANDYDLPADGFYVAATGQTTYRSFGQRCAARAAVALEPGGTLIAALPTGSGKTEVAFAAVHKDCEAGRVSVIVVPTVALALDLERRIRVTLQRAWGFGANVENMPFAWHGGTDAIQRGEIVARITRGEQRIIVTSPESIMTAGVGRALRDVAKIGRLGWFIVDEAHIIRQWGRTFRPEFLELGRLAGELAKSALSEGHEPCSTLLLSATLTDDHIKELREQFDGNQPVRLVAANEMRPEPEMWASGAFSMEERDEALVDCLMHLPRPAIVYATIPDEAERLIGVIRKAGLTRVASFTGNTVGEDRLEVLEKFRGDTPEGTSVDVVVATSAFGLGVDYDPVRTVIHACVPETIDRWYQEIGRAGRDGYVSVAVLLPAHRDIDIAMGMGVKRLEVDTFMARWAALRANAIKPKGVQSNWLVANLQITVGGVRYGSYNKRWNDQILRGLEELGYITTRRIWREEASHLGLSTEVDGVPAEWVAFRPTSKAIPHDLGPEWERWRGQHVSQEEARASAAQALLTVNPPLCDLLEAAFECGDTVMEYYPESISTYWASQTCGRCPLCRARNVSRQTPSTPNPMVAWSATDPTPIVWSWTPGLPVVVVAPPERHQELVDFHLDRGFQYLIAPPGIESKSRWRFRDLDGKSLLGTVGCATLMLSDDAVIPEIFRERALRYENFPHVFVTSAGPSTAASKHVWKWDQYLYGSLTQ